MKNPLLRIAAIFVLINMSLTAKAQFVTIPDPAFVTWLNMNGFSSCMSGNQLNTSCGTVVGALTIDCSSSNITDLTGIQYFTGVTALYCQNNMISNIPALPPSLIQLYADANNLSSLPALPSTLKNLSVYSNPSLSSLPSLPSVLIDLNASNCNLNSIPTLPASLKTLIVFNNQLSSLPALNNGLETLNCNFNNLNSIPTLPSTLKTLLCSDNQLTSIPTLPTPLLTLICNQNLITSLPVLPASLLTFTCNNNQISSLPVLPTALQSLICGYNPLTALPATLPNTLITLDITQSAINALPALPAKIKNIYLSNTAISSLPALPDTIFNLNIVNDTAISCLPPVSRIAATFLWSGSGLKCLSKPLSVNSPNPSIATLPVCSLTVITGVSSIYPGGCSVLTAKGGSTYQWLRNGNIITNATSSIYNATQAGTYTCNTTTDCGTYTTAPFILTQTSAATVSITASGPLTICPGNSLTLASSTGNGYIYQWRKDGIDISSANAISYNATTSGIYTVRVTDSLGCFAPILSNAIAITAGAPTAVISAPSPSLACSGSSLTLTANSAPGYIYKWYSGNAVEIVGQTTANYTATVNGNYYVKITDSIGCTDTSEAVTVLLGLTTATISSTQTVFCSGTYYTLYANTNGVVNSYQWKMNGVPIPGKTSYFMPTYAFPGNIYTVDITNQCGTYTSAPYFDSSFVSPPSVLTASGPTAFCPPGSVTLNANTASNYSYKWYKDYINAIVPGIITPSYTITTPGTYYVHVTDTLTGCGTVSAGIRVNNTGTNLILSPNTQNSYGACSSFVMTASPIPAGYTYEWVRNGVVVPGVNTQTYTTTTLSTPHQGISYDTYYVRAIGTCGTTQSNDVRLELKYQPLNPADVIIYPSTLVACDGESIGIGINRWVTDYYLQDVQIQWKLNGVAIPGATNNYYFATTSGNYSIDVTIPCGTTSSNVATLTFLPSPLAVITSNGTSLCGAGSSINLNVTTGSGNNYQWKNNNQILSGANSSTFTANNPGTYTCNVSASNGCKRTSNYINIFNGSNTSVAISGNNSFCRPSTGNIYTATLLSGANYSWTVPAGATITSGQGTNSITVSYASNASAGNISLNVTGNCGNSTVLKAITIRTSLPSSPGTITGVTNGCNGESKLYKIRQVRGADSYLWIPPAGATINGSSSSFATTDTAVTVTYTSAFTGDTLRVKSINCKGSSVERKLRINHNPPSVPGVISGLTNGLCNQNSVYSIVAVANATSYTWTSTIPGITFNGNVSPYTSASNSVSVSFGNFVSGRIQVNANNNCGSSGSRTMTVYARPALPSIINGPISVCDNQLGVVYSTPAVTNASAYNWTVPSGASIASGQNTTNIAVNFGATPLTGNVRVRSQNVCASSSYRNLSVTVNNCPRVGDDGISEIKIQPNPFTQSTTIILPDEVDASQCVLHVYDLFGRIVRTIRNPEGNNVIFEREDLSPGAYNLQLIYNKEQITTWIFVH